MLTVSFEYPGSRSEGIIRVSDPVARLTSNTKASSPGVGIYRRQSCVGRLHRLYPTKREVIVYDYGDEAVPMLKRMSEKRVRGYKSFGYSIGGGDT
jgi:hypothetical protein